MTFKTLGIAIVSSFCASTLVFAAADVKSFYVGGALAVTDYDDDGFYDAQRLDDSDSGGFMYGGYRYNDYVSFEVAISALGNYVAESPSVEIESVFGAFTGSILGQLPLGAGFSLYAKSGIGFASIYQDIAYATPAGLLVIDDEDDSGGVLVYGVGMNFIPNGLKNVQFRLGWERYSFSTDSVTVSGSGAIKDDVDHEIDMVHIGAAYNF